MSGRRRRFWKCSLICAMGSLRLGATFPLSHGTTTTRRRGSPLHEGSEIESAAAQPFVQKSLCLTGVAPRTGPLNEAVVRVAQLESLEHANRLIEIGAVWARMDALTEDDVLSQYDGDFESNARALYADLDNRRQGEYQYLSDKEEEMDLEAYVEQMSQQRFRRILTPALIEAGTDLRIYPHPRRFPACAEFANGRERLLYEDTSFLVVDKPPLLPTQPDASNYHECCPGCVQTHLGPFVDITGGVVPRPLLCHRVDSCVGGCVVLAKNPNAQKVFAEFQRDRKIRKVYLALTREPVPLGMHLHWMWAPQTQNRRGGKPPCQLIRHTPPESRRKARKFWIRCVLEVTKSETITIEPSSNPESSNVDWIEPGVYYQTTIRLVTGRKHQVRAQLASLGCPIIGDTLYQPMAGLTLDRMDSSSEADMERAISQCRVPVRPIGLQASAILFAGIRAKAGKPWWGDHKLIDH